LREGPDFQSILAIGMQTGDAGRLRVTQDGNQVHDIGNGGPGLTGSDSEGLFGELTGTSRLDVDVAHFTYTNPRGVGSFSANGMEMVVMGGSAKAAMRISNSSLTGPPGDVLEAAVLAGSGASVSLSLDKVIASRSSGNGGTAVIPFNNGDCLVAGDAGGGNDVSVKITDSELSGCANNGISVLNTEKPGSSLDVDIDRTHVSGNRGINLWVRNNGGAMRHLAVKVQHSAICDGGGANVQVEQLGQPGSGGIDLGGGPLGSAGGNDLSGSHGLDVSVLGTPVSAAHDWWGTASGPAAGKTLALAPLDASAPLGAAPAVSC
jgi:hypothetical protein